MPPSKGMRADIRLLPRIIAIFNLPAAEGFFVVIIKCAGAIIIEGRGQSLPRLQHMKTAHSRGWYCLSTRCCPAQSRRRHTIRAIFIAIFRGTDLAFNVQLQRAVRGGVADADIACTALNYKLRVCT